MRPELASFLAFLARVRRRLALKAAIDGAAAGVAVAIGLAIAIQPSGAMIAGSLSAVLVGSLISLLVTMKRRRETALVVEQRAPTSRNLIATAAELSANAVGGYGHELVMGRAATLVGELEPGRIVPTMRSTVIVVALVATWIAVAGRSVLPVPALLRTGPSVGSGPAIRSIDVIVAPPAYTGRAAETFRDPERVTALAGSKLSVTVRAAGDVVTMETLASQDTLTPRSGDFAGQLIADADGFIAVQARRGATSSTRRLIGLVVLPDSLPRVRIVAPARDERFPDAHRSLALTLEASDDIGLGSLAVRFTKVSGSGERFTFTEGQVPLTVSRRDDRGWTARAVWSLDSLGLEPGDMVVYRAIAADRRATGGTAESDSYIAEILAPGGVAAPGFAADFEQERYAVSQQMVIVKTERLIARRATLSAAALADEAQQLAAEQRKVRAEFVFMLGGELADAPDIAASMTDINEEEESGRESDILAGYGANAGHVALIRGIRAMSRAAASLTTADPVTALPHERAALAQLERAFSHSRILLRALATRERLDLSRRLTGSLSDAANDVRPLAEATRDATSVTLRRLLADVTTLAAKRDRGANDAAGTSVLAERTLRVDPSSPALQDVSAQLSKAAAAIASHQSDETVAALDKAASGLARVLRSELPDAPIGTRDLGERQMQGVIADVARGAKP